MIDGEEAVQSTLDGLGSFKDLALSNGFILTLAIIGGILLVLKWLKAKLQDQADINEEVRRQNAEMINRLDELGYDENGVDRFAQNDADNEDILLIESRQNTARGRNERIRTGRVSSRHYTGE